MKHSRNIFIILVVSLFFSSIVIAQPLFIQNIGKVSYGMTEPEVKKLCGSPNEERYRDDQKMFLYSHYNNGLSTEGQIKKEVSGAVVNDLFSRVAESFIIRGHSSALNYLSPVWTHSSTTVSSNFEKSRHYSANIVFNDGVVTSIGHNIPSNVANNNKSTPTNIRVDNNNSQSGVPAHMNKEDASNIPINTSDKYGTAKEGFVFTVSGSDLTHAMKYCTKVIGKRYQEVSSASLGKSFKKDSCKYAAGEESW